MGARAKTRAKSQTTRMPYELHCIMDALFKDQCHLYTYDDDDDGGGGGDRQRDLCLSLIYGLCERPWGREAHLTHVTVSFAAFIFLLL